MRLIDRAGRWFHPGILAALAAVLLAGGWLISGEARVGLTLMVPPLALAGFVARRRDDERVNPPQDERQRFLERSVLAWAGVAMFAAALAGMVWELASGLPITELRATAILLVGALTAMVSEQVLHRRT